MRVMCVLIVLSAARKALDTGWQRDHLAVVAFVQEIRGRAILASASVPVKNARP